MDASKAGWIAIVIGPSGFQRAIVAPRFSALVAELDDAVAIGVDIPIGLPNTAPRAADAAARAFVGPRRASVFTTPPRAVLEASDYQAARAVATARYSTGVSAQSYALAPKVHEVEALAVHDTRIVEMHPEVSFRAMAEASLQHPKKTWNGHAWRRSLLEGHGIAIPDDLGEAGVVAPDDVLDAAAAAWSARRKALGLAHSLPDPPEHLDGITAAIWY